MKKLLTAALMAICVSAPAVAADATDWVIVTTSTNDDGAVGAFLVDKASIKDSSDGKHADVMLIAKDQYADYLMVLDCKGHRWSYTAAKLVTGDKPKYENGDGWDDAPLGTPMRDVLDYVCSGGATAVPAAKVLGPGDPVAATRAWIAPRQ